MLILFQIVASLTVCGDEKGVHPDVMLLEGKWTVVSSEFEGKQSPQPVGAVISFHGMRVTSKYGDKAFEDRFEIDGNRKPKWITLTRVGSRDEVRTFRGIYRFEGQTLTICHGQPDDKRPTTFTTMAGDGRSIAVLKHVENNHATPESP